MELTKPSQLAWAISVILVLLGLIGSLATLRVLSEYAFWLVCIGAVLLILATLLRDL